MTAPGPPHEGRARTKARRQRTVAAFADVLIAGERELLTPEELAAADQAWEHSIAHA